MPSLRSFSSIADRRMFLEQQTNTSLHNVGSYSLDEANASTKHCENMIGIAQVPIGVTGPLKIKFQIPNSLAEPDLAKREKLPYSKNYYIPLATTEGALIASVSRGCKAISESGGARVNIELVGVTRGSVFRKTQIAKLKSQNHNTNSKIVEFITTNFTRLQEIASQTSSHLTLMKYDIQEVGKYVFVRWYFDTADAMGMNMATIASEQLAAHIETNMHMKCIAVAGNFDVDKKASFLNFIEGRGRTVSAEVTVPKSIVASVLKTTPEKIAEVWKAKCMIGSALSGSLGYNAQYANIIAALFIATGQDPAHVVEGSLGMTIVEVEENGDLYCSVFLPALMVGTVGGGTGLATQKEALEMLGCSGDGKVNEFAGIVGGAVLAGEISLLASLAEGSLACSHMKLARAHDRKSKLKLRFAF